jgi:tetratricopeptide (TPR) repeat protein
LRAGACLLLAGNEPHYRELCAWITARLADGATPDDRRRLVKACLLAPGVVDATALPAAQLEEDTRAGRAPAQFVGAAWGILALAAYRTRDFDRAVACCGLSLEQSNSAPIQAQTLLVRALAEQNLGRIEDAAATLASAVKLFPPELVPLMAGKYSGGVPEAAVVQQDWLIAEVLRREAAGRSPDQGGNGER